LGCLGGKSNEESPLVKSFDLVKSSTPPLFLSINQFSVCTTDIGTILRRKKMRLCCVHDIFSQV